MGDVKLSECGECTCTAECMKESSKYAQPGVTFVPETELTKAQARIAELEGEHDEAVSDFNELARQLLCIRTAIKELAEEARIIGMVAFASVDAGCHIGATEWREGLEKVQKLAHALEDKLKEQSK